MLTGCWQVAFTSLAGVSHRVSPVALTGAEVAEQLLRSRTLLPEQARAVRAVPGPSNSALSALLHRATESGAGPSIRCKATALHTRTRWLSLLFSCAERQTPCSRCVTRRLARAESLPTQPHLNSIAQRGAANLYTSSLRPWLAGMRLPWAQDSTVPMAPWSAHEHVVWASEKHTPEKAVALAAAVPLVLQCHLAVERRVSLHLSSSRRGPDACSCRARCLLPDPLHKLTGCCMWCAR